MVIANSLVSECVRFLEECDTGRAVRGPSEDKYNLVRYHRDKGTLSTHRGEQGQLDGLAMFYLFEGPWSLEDILNWRPDDINGSSFVLAYMLSTDSLATREIIEGMLRKFPDWENKNIYAIRKDRIVKYETSIVRKMLHHLN